MKITVFAALLLVFAAKCFAADETKAEPSNSHYEATARLLNVMDMKSMLLSFFDAELQKRGSSEVSREIALRIIAQRLDWKPVTEKLIPVYMAAFSEDEAKQLTAFYQSDLGRKVLSKEAFVQSEVLKTFQTSPETIRSLFVAGCVGGGIGGQVESVEKAMATVDAKLPSKEVMY